MERLQMRTVWVVSPVFFWLLWFTPGLANANTPAFLQQWHTLPLEVSQGSPDYTTISLRSPELVITDHVVGFEVFQAVEIPGEPTLPQEGNPVLPQITRFYRIPETGGVELAIQQAAFDLRGNFNPLPYTDPPNAEGGIARNMAVFGADAWYPPHVAEVSEPMIMRDFRVVMVTLYPVQVNPVTRQARIYHTLDVALTANSEPGVNELTRPRRPSGAWTPIYRTMIRNLDERALDDATIVPGSYLILCRSDNSARQWADSLAIWKRLLGYDVEIDARASWTAAAMIAAIRSAYSTFDPPLEYVTLIGDPQWSYGVPTDGSNFDHSFALGNTGDDLEDIFIGRLSGSSTVEMATINAKLMSYERSPRMVDQNGQPDTEWFTKGFFYAGIAMQQPGNYNLMQWADQQFRNHTGVQNNLVAWVNGAVDENLIRSQINSGIGYFLWQGSWLGQMQLGLAGSTTPAWRLPVCVTITEGTGDFHSGWAISESWLVAGTPANPRGGICGIGTATSAVQWGPAATLTGGLVYGIANRGLENLGASLTMGKIWVFLTYGTLNNHAANMSRWANLMGEPSLQMWKQVPVLMTVTHAETLAVGARELRVECYAENGPPVPDVLVVLWDRNQGYIRALTDAAGVARLPVTVNSEGDYLLAVTKNQHKPYLRDIPARAVSRHVALRAVTLDDDNVGGTSGNGDGLLNPGEIIDVRAWLGNTGTSQTATGITAQLSAHNPYVTVVQNSSAYPDLAPGDSSLGAAPFRIQAAPHMPHDMIAVFDLNVTFSTGAARSAFELTCRAPELRITALSSDPPLLPGATSNIIVTLMNTGALAMPGATARLVSLSPLVGVTGAPVAYGDIPAGQQRTNTGNPFALFARSYTMPGHVAELLLVASSPSLFVDSTRFTLQVGTAASHDPTGPDAYGYFAYDNTDTTYDRCPPFAFFAIDAVGTNLQLNDPGEQTVIGLPITRARALPFRFRFYGQDYDTISISSNGWCAFGNQEWNDAFRNYPIPGIIAPDAMIAAYWDDLQTTGTGRGVWDYYDAQNHRYVVQWKAVIGSTQLDFEVMLFDPVYHQTNDGNGEILIQYSLVTMNVPGDYQEPPGCTIGIQAPGGLVGLQYAYAATYAAGAAAVVPGRAIRFSTEAQYPRGALTGHVIDSASGLPLRGVRVNFDGPGVFALTDDLGFYELYNVPADTYAVRARLRRYNDGVQSAVVIRPNATTIADFSLLHPDLALSSDSIAISVTNQVRDTAFVIINSGNGPLDCRLAADYRGADTLSPWGRFHTVPVSADVYDDQIWGCEFDGRFWWVSGSGTGGVPRFYRYDRAWNYRGAIPQPTGAEFGWRDFAFDGRYLYGTGISEIVGIDTAGVVQVRIPSLLNITRALAYDSVTDHFWIADYASDIYEIDRSGAVLRQINNAGGNTLFISGLAWNVADPDGFRLYVFSQNGTPAATRVTRINPQTLVRRTVGDIPARPGDRAGGCTITHQWDGSRLVFGGIFQSDSGDVLGIHDIARNTSWISVAPLAASVPPGGAQTVMLTIDPALLYPLVYAMQVAVRSDVLDTTVILPLTVSVTSVPVQEPERAAPPAVFALHPNFPNPFNPQTSIRFDLPQAARVNLRVFNTLGQEVAVLAEQVYPAGTHHVVWDGRTHGGDAASGLYFCHIQAGSFSSTRKLVLMR